MGSIVHNVEGPDYNGYRILVCEDGTRYRVPADCKIGKGAELEPISGQVDTYEGLETATATTSGLCERCGGCTLNNLYRAIFGRQASERRISESMVS